MVSTQGRSKARGRGVPVQREQVALVASEFLAVHEGIDDGLRGHLRGFGPEGSHNDEQNRCSKAQTDVAHPASSLLGPKPLAFDEIPSFLSRLRLLSLYAKQIRLPWGHNMKPATLFAGF